MISPANLEKVLRTARKHGVIKLNFSETGEISSIIFERKGATIPAKGKQIPKTKNDYPPMEMDLPSDEELRYLSTDFVPASMAPDKSKEELPNQLAS